MSTFLSPAQYNQAETEGLVPLCCRAIECFRPTVFAAVGFPFAISSMSELWRYTESMHEGIGLPQPMEDYLFTTILNGGLTEQEIDDTKRVTLALDDLARSIGRPVQYPIHSLLLAFNQLRHISCLVAPGSTVVEMGGGAGYLGVLLALRGYRYVATDVSQVFYILQSNLLSRLAPGGHIDLVDTRYGADDLRALKPGQAATVPWWRWAQRSTLSGLSIDLATSNHNLLEMHPRSRLYHLAAVRERLSPEGVGFIFEGWGDPSRYPRWMGVKDFSDHGYVLTHHDIRIHCFAPRERHAEGTVLRFPLPVEGGHPSAPAPAHATTETSSASFWEQAQRGLSNRAYAALMQGRTDVPQLSARLDRLEPAFDLHHQREAGFAIPDFSSENNSTSRAILAMRAAEKAKARRTLKDYKQCFGPDDISAEDDRFLAYVYRGTSLGRPWITTLPK